MKQTFFSTDRRCHLNFPAILILAAFTWVGATPRLSAQGYAIKWGNFGGGGGSSAGAIYSVRGTIGQLDASQQRTEDYLLNAGFWSVAGAVSSEDGPTLRIVPSGRFVTVAWPDPSTGFQLQESPTLVPSVWKDVTVTPTIVGTEKQVRVTLQSGSQFFRLRRPPER